MFSKLRQFFFVSTLLLCAITAQSQTCTGSLTVTITGSADGSALAPPTGAASQTFCAGATVNDLAASGKTGAAIKWYDAATGGNIVSTTTTLVNNNHYFASQTVSGCESTNRLDVTATVTPLPTLVLSSVANTDAQTICQNVNITNITYTVGSATGATVSGLPSGVTGIFASGVFTISGAPSDVGTFNYTVTTSGGCSPAATKSGTITVTPLPTVTLSSATNTDAQSVCQNLAITTITYTITNATNGSVTGLPTGVTGTYTANVVTISGTPSVSGTFNYTVTTSGGCTPAATKTGTITVTPAVVAGTCTVADDKCQLGAGQIKVEVTAGTSPFTITATSKTVAPSPLPGTVSNLTSPTPTNVSGVTTYLFTNLPGNAEYKFKVTDTKGCFVGGTHQ